MRNHCTEKNASNAAAAEEEEEYSEYKAKVLIKRVVEILLEGDE